MKKNRATIPLLIASLFLLLAACSASRSAEAPTPEADPGLFYATDGDIFYPQQYIPYATDGNVDTAEFSVVHVETVDELLHAIAPETVILLADGEYNLSAASPDFFDYCYFRPATYPEVGEHTLVLSNLWDCVIASESGESGAVRILATPRTVPVLTLENSYALQLRGLTVGHTQSTDACSAEVIALENSGSVYMEGCELFGCGSTGVRASSCYGITLRDTLIRDCSAGGASFAVCESVMLDGVTLRNTGAFQPLSLQECSYISAQNCSIEENLSENFLLASCSDHLFFNDCSFRNNRFSCLLSLWGDSAPEFWRCEVGEEQYKALYSDEENWLRARLDGEIWR